MMLKNEKGLSLVELLATLSIMMIVMVAAYQAFYFVSNAITASSNMTELRKEANILILSMENALINVDSITLPEDTPHDSFQEFTGNIKYLSGMEEESTTFVYTEETVDVSIAEGGLLIDGKRVNAEDMDLSNTTFEQNGDKLKVNLNIQKQGTDEDYGLVKIFNIGNE